MSKKIVLTGSSGFIGRRLFQKLSEAGHEVIPLDKGVGIDITCWEQIKMISNFDFVIHLASLSYVPYSVSHPRRVLLENTTGTLNCLELCRINSARLIYSSSYVYGVPQFLPINENHSVVGTNPYSYSKLIGEQLCEAYNRNYSVPVVILRLFNPYGPGQKEEFLVPKIIKKLLKEGKVMLESSKPKRDFIYIDDVINAYFRCLQYKSNNVEIFNIGSGESISVKEIANQIKGLLCKDVHIEYNEKERASEIWDTVADISKAKRELNWCPAFDLNEGLRLTIEYFLQDYGL